VFYSTITTSLLILNVCNEFVFNHVFLAIMFFGQQINDNILGLVV
jgi:hypothetical protein